MLLPISQALISLKSALILTIIAAAIVAFKETADVTADTMVIGEMETDVATTAAVVVMAIGDETMTLDVVMVAGDQAMGADTSQKFATHKTQEAATLKQEAANPLRYLGKEPLNFAAGIVADLELADL